MSEIVIVDGTRTPHGSLLGTLADVSCVELGTTAVRGLLDRVSIEPAAVDWLCLGNAIQAGIGQVPARQVAVETSLPDGTPATTVNEASGSGLRAIALAVDRLQAGRTNVAIAGGMESMSNAPYLVSGMRAGHRHGDTTLVDAMIRDSLWDLTYDAHMGKLTERLVERFDISRKAQDEYALESHRRAVRAVEDGLFAEEIVPVIGPDSTEHTTDEGPRPDTNMEMLSDLSPAFDSDGTITAGNASGLSDGAGCVLLATKEAAENAGSDPLATVVDYAVAYRDPQWFGMAVGDAVAALLEQHDLVVEDIDMFELNEAFAAQMVYVADRLDIPREKHNPRGEAIALGHPIGASGGILTTTLVHTMAASDMTRGIVGMSVGGGGGLAMLVER